MPDFFGRMVSLMNTQAQTNLINQEAQDYGQLAQERQLQIKQMQQRQQDEQLTRQILMDTAAGRQTTQFRADQQVEGDSYITDLNAQLRRDQQEVSQLRQVSAALMDRGVSPDIIEKYQKDANAAEQRMIGTERELRMYQRDLMKQVGGIAGTAHDDDSFRQAYQQIAQLNPMLARSLNIDRDANGIPMYGPRSQASMNSLFQSSMDPAQQIDRSIKVQDELRKQAAEERAQEDEKRKTQDSNEKVALTRAQVESTKALTKEREQRAKQIEAKTNRLDSVASKPSTPAMKGMARDSIKALDEFKDAKWDDTLDAFAGDVADRANKIRADAAKEGDDMSLDDARQQAIAELKFNVKKGTAGGIDLPVIGNVMGKDTYSYRRGGTGGSPSTAVDMPANPTKESLSKGQVYHTPKGDLRWNGTVFEKP